MFGTTTQGGAHGDGTLFELENHGGSYTLTTLLNFGAIPDGPLLVDSAGDIFGTTDTGGANGRGTVFELSRPVTQLEISGSLTLNGGDGSATGPGQVLLSDSSGNFIVSDGSPAALTNVDNTISGAGTIGDANLTLDNEQYGVIDANYSIPLILVTGVNTIANAGTLEATNGGTLIIDGNVSGSGSAEISSGGTLELGGADAQSVTFNGGGTLLLEGCSDFSGTVSGLAVGDVIDLANVAVTSAVFTGSTLTIDGTPTAFQILNFPTGDIFTLTNDGNGGTDLTVQPQLPGLTLTVPGAQTLQQGNTAAIAGVSLSETDNTAGETFTVTLTDTHGDLSANTSATGGGGTIAGSGTTSLTITGTLSQVNSELGMLTDTDATAGGDLITLNATDSFGNFSSQSIASTVDPLVLVLMVPGAQTLQQGNTAAIAGVSLAETNNTVGETFTVALTDAHGALSVSGNGLSGVSGSGTNDLTFTGSLSQVNTDLAALHDTDAAAGADLITLNATDSFGNLASQTITVGVDPLQPVLMVPGAQTLQQGNTVAIAGVSLAETNNTVGETFTVALTDAHGALSVSGNGLSGVSGSGTNDLTFTGSLSQVNTDLAALHDTDAAAGTDLITLNATDSFGNVVSQTIGVTVGPVAPTLTIASSSLTVNEGAAVALGIGEIPANPNDTVSVKIAGIPTGAMLTDATGDTLTVTSGAITLNPAELAGLTLYADEANSSTLTVTAINTGGAMAFSAPQTIDLTVNPAAPTLTATPDRTVSEDGFASLNISVTPFSPSDPLTITIAGVPTDATLSAGINNGNGDWTLTPAELTNLTLHAGEVATPIMLVTATNSAGTIASSSFGFLLNISPVAPFLTVADGLLSGTLRCNRTAQWHSGSAKHRGIRATASPLQSRAFHPMRR